VRILDDRIAERLAAAVAFGGAVRTGILPVAVGPLSDVPAVVPALLEAVDLFVVALADVRDEAVAVVEREPPGVPKTPRVVLVEASPSNERVVVGDGVRSIGRPIVDVESQDATQNVRRNILTAAASAAARADADVEEPVRSEREIPRCGSPPVGESRGRRGRCLGEPSFRRRSLGTTRGSPCGRNPPAFQTDAVR